VISSSGAPVATLTTRYAISSDQHQRGLMFRKSLNADEAMVFVYPHVSKKVLWMKNTDVPLEATWWKEDGMKYLLLEWV
jgi:uncharacterized protein